MSAELKQLWEQVNGEGNFIANEERLAKFVAALPAQQPDFSQSKTGNVELWKNPLFPMHERLEIADGAIAYRDQIIEQLREKYEGDSKLTIHPRTYAGFAAAFYAEHKREASTQEIWNEAVMVGRAAILDSKQMLTPEEILKIVQQTGPASRYTLWEDDHFLAFAYAIMKDFSVEKLITYDVDIATMVESHRTTYHVLITRSDRPESAGMMDDTGRFDVFHSEIHEHAVLTMQEWIDFLKGVHPVCYTSTTIDRIAIQNIRKKIDAIRDALSKYRDELGTETAELARAICLASIADIVNFRFGETRG